MQCLCHFTSVVFSKKKKVQIFVSYWRNDVFGFDHFIFTLQEKKKCKSWSDGRLEFGN